MADKTPKKTSKKIAKKSSEKGSKPPKTYSAFVKDFPKLGQAWDLMREEEEQGPFDRRTVRLLKLAIAVGAGKEGAVHSCVRKASEAGCTPAELRHVAALAASTVGLPPAVATYSWIVERLGS